MPRTKAAAATAARRSSRLSSSLGGRARNKMAAARVQAHMSADIALLVLRVVVGGVVMQHGLLKLGWVGTGGSIKGVAGWFNGMGLKPGLFWALVAVAAEAGGGLLTVLGLGGPLGPAILAGDMVVVTIVAHVPQGFWAGGGMVGWGFPIPLAAAGLANGAS